MNPSSPPPPNPDPLAPLRGKFPRWEAWRGVTGILYARRRKTSPPPVLRGKTAAELARKIRAWEAGDRYNLEGD